MANIELRQVEKKFGTSYAVKPLDLTIKDGEFIILLGPSGCGKTTTLRMISGLETVSGGNILFDGKDVTWNHPSERNIAFVFQFFALYSHLTAHDNIAFPLQAEGQSREAIRKQVTQVAQLLRIEHLLNKRPGGLSGGDQQRVALARALVRRPAAFLMDEPLGALDAEFRETMRAEIKRLHIDQHATTLYVTHDQIEAMAMGDRIVVMSNAEVQQAATPTEVYQTPANIFVARFIGSPGMNLVPAYYGEGMITLEGGSTFAVDEGWRRALDAGLAEDGSVIVGFRPEAAKVSVEGSIRGTTYASDMHGGYNMLHIEIAPHQIVHVRTTRQISYAIGENLRFDINPQMVRFFHPQTELALQKAGASPMSNVRLENVSKTFRNLKALNDVSLTINDGEFFVLLGPTGAGKTTTLRVIAGLERQDTGHVYFDDVPADAVTPADRDTAFVFQQYSLYPNMTVYDNLAFPLRAPLRRVPEPEIKERVGSAAEKLRITHLLERKTGRLSGGEMQRVSIGRAIIREPRIFLMDEPLSNLDAKLREALRVELKHLQKTQHSTTLFVTHDQIEAMTMADRIAVLDHGHVLQIGTPTEIYDYPATTVVAQLVGTPRINLFSSTSSERHFSVDDSPLSFAHVPVPHGEHFTLGIRPEDVVISSTGKFSGQVGLIEPLGVETIIHIRSGELVLLSIVPGTMTYGIDSEIRFDIAPERLHFFGEDGKRLVG